MEIPFTMFRAWEVTQKLWLEIPTAIKQWDVNVCDQVVAKLDFYNNTFHLSVYMQRNKVVTTTDDYNMVVTEEGDLVFSATGATFDQIHDALHSWVTVEYPAYLATIDVAAIDDRLTQLRAVKFEDCLKLADSPRYEANAPFFFKERIGDHMVKFHVFRNYNGLCLAKVLRIDPL